MTTSTCTSGKTTWTRLGSYTNQPATAQSSVWNCTTARAKPLPCSLPGASKAKRQWTLGMPRCPHSREYNHHEMDTTMLRTNDRPVGINRRRRGDGQTTPPRIVTLGGTITEIVFALGAGERVVGVDASSSFPEAVNQLPKVAYHRRLSAEGVLSLRPTLIIATTEAGPPEAIQQLRSAGVTVLVLPHDPTVEKRHRQDRTHRCRAGSSSAWHGTDPSSQKGAESGTILHSTHRGPSQNSLSSTPAAKAR